MPPDLEATLRKLEALHQQIGQEIAALRHLQEQYGLDVFHGTIEIPPPYGKEAKTNFKAPAPFSLSVPAAQPELTTDLPTKPTDRPAVRTTKPLAKKSRSKPTEDPPTKEQFEAARSILMDGYTPDRPGDGDRLLKTIVYRLLHAAAKDSNLPNSVPPAPWPCISSNRPACVQGLASGTGSSARS